MKKPKATAAPLGLTVEQQAAVAGAVAEGLAMQHKFRPEPLYKTRGRGHYESNTVEEIRQAKAAAPAAGQRETLSTTSQSRAGGPRVPSATDGCGVTGQATACNPERTLRRLVSSGPSPAR